VASLTYELVKSRLLEEDEVKKATYQSINTSSKNRPHEVGKPKDPSSKLTKVTQVEVPGASEKARRAPKSTKATDKTGIPQANFAGEYVDKMDKPSMSKAANEKSPRIPSVQQGPKPNQSTKLKNVNKTIRNTEEGLGGSNSIPQADFANSYTSKMPHGTKTMNTGSDNVPTVGKPKYNKMNATTRPKGGERKPKGLGDAKSGSVSQVKSPDKKASEPSDAPKKPTWKTHKKGHNVLGEVAIKLGGKTKAVFDVVNPKIVQGMVESYQQHGYKLEVTRSDKPAAWKSDRAFLSMVRESVDAKHNFLPSQAKEIRREAFNRFRTLCKESYNDLYESRQEFLLTLQEAFRKIVENAETKYLDSLEVFDCTARVNLGEDVADVTIVTEATDHAMALRQIRRQIAEEFGLEADIAHIFVDGKKYRPNQIKGWTRK
jgi:hypothetical protein